MYSHSCVVTVMSMSGADIVAGKKIVVAGGSLTERVVRTSILTLAIQGLYFTKWWLSTRGSLYGGWSKESAGRHGKSHWKVVPPGSDAQ